MSAKPPAPKDFKYDVAVSFLWKDESLARELKSRLAPGLRVYVASQEAEATLGRDGMESFRNVFRNESRLSVILYREGWGDTKFTAVEEAGIKDRAFKTNLKSFMLVKLDDAKLREWMPEQHLYVAVGDYSTSDVVAIIKARATEVGAEVKKESAAQAALRKGRAAHAKAERQERFRSHGAQAEVTAELHELFSSICAQVNEVVDESETLLEVSCQVVSAYSCMISGSRVSTGMMYRQRAANRVEDAVLRVAQWDGAAVVVPGGNIGAQRFVSAMHYSPVISDEDTWVWRERWDREEPSSLVVISLESEPLSRAQLADVIVQRYFDRFFGR